MRQGQGARGWTGALGLALGLAGCAEGSTGREETGLEALGLTDLNPKIILPGTRIELDGRSFLDAPLGISWLRLTGSYAGAPIDAFVPADFVDFEHMQIHATPELLRLLGPGPGSFAGRVSVEVDFVPEGTRHSSVPLSMQLDFVDHLEPSLDAVQANDVIFVNEPIEVVGQGILLGGDEGTTYAVVEGCFRPVDGSSCDPVAATEIEVAPAEPFVRDRGVFPFSPHIAGIRAGTFEGSVYLRNDHADGQVHQSETQAIHYDLAESLVSWVGDESGEAVGTLGRFVDVQGGGFVGPDDGGLTSLVFQGTYFPDTGGEAPVSLQVIPEFVDGRRVRYVVNEEDALAQAIDIRLASGTFVGQVHPVVEFLDDNVEGQPTDVTLRLEPVKQVVFVQFNPTYVESLRLFGVRALDTQIRARIMEVLRRDYEAINVEFREEEPTDYKLYAVVEIAGPDPNGLGLLGYDNTPGKDIDNLRLDDRIGGVNAQTLEGGLPGFGGVFMESLFSFSMHPPADTVPSAEVATVTFDQIFDPLRPDRGGRPVSSSDFAGGPVPTVTSGAVCPASDRATQIACAVFVLGSVVGTTVSHELGHSLGLAEPLGPPDQFHNAGDLPNRLMDAGGARSFEERAELQGQGPSRFCVQSYEYLRAILPTTELDPPIDRPPC